MSSRGILEERFWEMVPLAILLAKRHLILRVILAFDRIFVLVISRRRYLFSTISEKRLVVFHKNYTIRHEFKCVFTARTFPLHEQLFFRLFST